MAKKKNQANKETSHGSNEGNENEENIDEGEEDLGLSEEESSVGETDFDELERGANVDARPAARTADVPIARDHRHVTEPAARLVPAGPDKRVLKGLRDQVVSVVQALQTEDNPKLAKARDHVTQAVTWLDDFLASK